MEAYLIENRAARSSSVHNSRYRTLDGVRGVVAICVSLFHLGVSSHKFSIPAGYLAVDVFFVLSGFVLYKSYATRIGEKDGFHRYIVGRVIRIYPLYIAGLVIGLFAQLLDPGTNSVHLLRSFIFNLFLLPMPQGLHQRLFPFNSPMWSLFYEMLASIAFGLLLHRTSQKRLMTLAGLSMVVLIFVGFRSSHTLDQGYILDAADVLGATARVGFSFTAGVLLAKKGPTSRKVSWLSVFVLFVSVLLLSASIDALSKSLRDLTLVLFACPILVWWAAHMEPPVALQRPFEALGDISFPLYAIHEPAVRFWVMLFRHYQWPVWTCISTYLIVMCTAAAAVAHFYDRNTRALLSQALRVRESSPPQVL